MIIDAHQHFWDRNRADFAYSWLDTPEHQPIAASFLPEDLQPLIQQAGVDKTVFVQTQHNLDENRWVLQLAEQHDFIAGVVGWVDLRANDCEDQVLEFKDHPQFVGIRHITQDEPDDDFIVRPEVIRGLKILEQHSVPFDLLFFVKHLKHAVTVARACPSLPLVIDHLAKPNIKDQILDDWEPHFRAAAQCENVWCKLSGMVTEADWRNWTVDDLRPYVDIALDCFGPSRLLFGSDWPVSFLAAEYPRVVGAARELTAELSVDEQSRIFGETAISFYGLPV